MKKSTLIVLLLGWVSATFANTINQGATLTILNGTTLTNIGTFENVGTVNNEGGAIFNNTGTFDNDGILNNDAGAVLNNTGNFNNTSLINNDGTLEIIDGVFNNTGTPAVDGLVRFTGIGGGLNGFSTFTENVEVDVVTEVDVIAGESTFDDNLYIISGNLNIIGGGNKIDYGVNANLIYNGTTPTISGSEFPRHGAPYNPKFIRIANPAGVTILAASQVLYTLVLEQGVLTTNDNLFLASTAAQTGIVDDFSGAYTGTISGNMTVERYVTNPPVAATPGGLHFHYIGTPIVGANASGWAGDFPITQYNNAVNGSPVIPRPDCDPRYLQTGSPYGSLFTYDESIVTFCHFEGWRVRTGAEPASRGKGFAASIPSSRLIDQEGAYANSNTNLSLSTTSTDPNWEGFHLVSNPFCAPINWTTNNLSNSDIDGAAYVYNPNGGNFIVFNNLNQGYLGTSQGFFIRANPTARAGSSFNFTLDENARVTTNNNTYYRTGQPYEFALGIEVTSPTNWKDNTLLAFDPSFHDDFDVAYDASKMYSDIGVPSIYTQAMNGDKLAIHALPVNTGLITVPLSLKTQSTGSFKLDFSEVHTFPSTMMITLEDKTTGTFQDIRMYPQYVFNATTNDAEDRFLLHFTPQLIVSTTDMDCSGKNGGISLEQQGGVIWNYSVVDGEGNSVAAKSGFTLYDTITALNPGTYTIRLSHSSGYQTFEEVTVHGAAMVDAAIIASATNVEQMQELTFESAGNATQYSWDMGDGNVLSNMNSRFRYIYEEPGTYVVRLIGSNGSCTDEVTLNITVTAKGEVQVENPNPNPSDPTTGAPVESFDQHLTVYHVDGKLFIKQTMEKGDSKLTLGLFNPLGQQVQGITSVLPYNQLQVYSLNELAAGPYFVRAILGDNGKNSATKKIIVAR